MRYCFLFIAALFYTSICFSQQVVERKNKLTSSVTERYHAIIEAKKEVKQGLYQAVLSKSAVASGAYTNDKRTGTWHFFDTKGNVIEHYNYDTNTLIYEAPEDSTSNFRYFVDKKLNPGDRVNKPVKIGGRYFAYLPYLKAFKLPSGVPNNGREPYNIKLELLISPYGRLADYKIHLFVNGDELIQYVDPDIFTDEVKAFIPATLNNEPVTCRIFIQCYLNAYDEIDM